jgi:tetratricopeptide (TPR) repeat protein
LNNRFGNPTLFHDLSQDGTRVAWYDTQSKQIHVRGVLPDVELMSLPFENPPALGLSPDGSTLAVITPASRQAELWDVNTRTRMLAGRLTDGDQIRALAVRPDGRSCAVVSHGDTVNLFDTAPGNNRVLLRWPQQGVHCLEFSPDGKRLLVGVDRKLQREGAVLVFDVATGQEIVTLPLPFPVKKLHFSKDGRCLVVTDAQQQMRVLETGDASARQRRDLVLARRSSWHMGEAARCEASGNREGAAWHLERVPAEELTNPALLLLRARLRGERAQWKSAAADLELALEHPAAVKKMTSNELYHLAWLALEGDNLKVYRRLCAQVRLLRSAASRNGVPAADQVRLLTLGPRAVDDYAPVVRLAEQAVAAYPDNSSFLFALGCAYYRAGRFEDAIARLLEHRHREPNWSGHAVTSLMVALAHHHLGRHEEARAHYAEGSAWIKDATRDLPPDQIVTLKMPRRTAQALSLLRREADTVFALPGPSSK